MQQCGFKISFIFYVNKILSYKTHTNYYKKYIKESGFDNINEYEVKKIRKSLEKTNL